MRYLFLFIVINISLFADESIYKVCTLYKTASVINGNISNITDYKERDVKLFTEGFEVPFIMTKKELSYGLRTNPDYFYKYSYTTKEGAYIYEDVDYGTISYSPINDFLIFNHKRYGTISNIDFYKCKEPSFLIEKQMQSIKMLYMK